MKVKHTPGPWMVMPGTGKPRVCVEGDSEWPIVVVSSGHSEAAAFANEMLIAAAPELLEAVKVLYEYAYHLETDDRIKGLELGKKAIAKAEWKSK